MTNMYSDITDIVWSKYVKHSKYASLLHLYQFDIISVELDVNFAKFHNVWLGFKHYKKHITFIGANAVMLNTCGGYSLYNKRAIAMSSIKKQQSELFYNMSTDIQNICTDFVEYLCLNFDEVYKECISFIKQIQQYAKR